MGGFSLDAADRLYRIIGDNTNEYDRLRQEKDFDIYVQHHWPEISELLHNTGKRDNQ